MVVVWDRPKHVPNQITAVAVVIVMNSSKNIPDSTGSGMRVASSVRIFSNAFQTSISGSSTVGKSCYKLMGIIELNIFLSSLWLIMLICDPNSYTVYSLPSDYENYIQNMRLQANNFLISCHECGHHFRSAEQFKEHVNLNHLVTKRFYHNFVNSSEEQTDFTCEHCAKMLRNKPEFVKHVMKEHYQYHVMYDCDKCGKQYSRLSELSRHKRCVHEPSLRHQCTYCGKYFQRKDHLAAHVLRIHENGQIYECEKCNIRFNKKSTLDRHLSSSRNGNGSYKYQCSDCELGFCTGKQMHAHLNDHIGLACENCGEMFKRIDNLQRHVRKRNAMNCSYCGENFCNEPSLRKHKYKLHLDDLFADAS